MTTPSTTSNAMVEDNLRSVLASGERPKNANALSASLTFGWRALLKIKHVPEQLFDAVFNPIIFTLLFTYLLGGAIAGSTGAYLQYLIPGILVQTVLLITAYTAVNLNTDISKGVADRFRSLPIWRPAVIVGALLGDALRYTLASAIVLVLGLVLGFHPEGGVLGVLLTPNFRAKREGSHSGARQHNAGDLSWFPTTARVGIREDRQHDRVCPKFVGDANHLRTPLRLRTLPHQ